MTDLAIRTIRKAVVPAPTVRDLLMPLFRKKAVMLVLFVGILLGTVLWSVLSPRLYVSEIQILVSRQPYDAVFVSGAPEPAEMVPVRVTADDVNLQMQLLKSRDVLAGIVQACGLENENSASEQSTFLARFLPRSSTPREKPIAQATQELSDQLKVEPVNGTALIRVAYTSQDAGLAARVVHAAAALLEEKQAALLAPANSPASLGRETDHYRASLETADRQLANFDWAHSYAALETQKQEALQQLERLETALQQHQTAAYGSEQRAKTLKQESDELPERRVTSTRETDNAELLPQLRETLLSLELKRTDLLQRYAPAYPLVQAVEIEIAQTRVAIAQAEESPLTETVIDRDPTKDWITTQLAKTDADYAAFQAESEFTARAVRHYQDAVQKFDRTSADRDELAKNVKIAEDDYSRYRSEVERTLLAQATNGGNVSLSFSEVATNLAEPLLRPEWLLIGGFFTAGFVSTGAAYALDRIDSSIRTPDELSGLLDMEVLAAIPVTVKGFKYVP